jgi:transposase InsO family protein
LADQGRYVASESTLYRLLHQAGQMTHRQLGRTPSKRSKPRALMAQQPDQIYCWDITYLPTQLRGTHYYLYLFVDLFSRKIVGWQVFDSESAQRASDLLQDICARQGIAPGQLVVHSDNGSPMKGETMLATMQRLGVAASRSRPSVSNDNPYSESLFRTLKYRPELPITPIGALVQRRAPPQRHRLCHPHSTTCGPRQGLAKTPHHGLRVGTPSQSSALVQHDTRLAPYRLRSPEPGKTNNRKGP